LNFSAKTFTLKDGRLCIFRAPCPDDAQGLIDYLHVIGAETEYVLWSPKSVFPTIEREQTIIKHWRDDPDAMVVLAEVDGECAGNCHIAFESQWKTAHRASVAIALKQKFWGCGIGTALMTEVLAEAKRRGVLQVELDVVSENVRAQALYKKMGFEIVATLPNAIRFSDGSLHDEYRMIKTMLE